MVNLFPRSNSMALASFVEPFGRLVIAHGRATTALIALARLERESEQEAVTYISGTDELPKRMRRLFRGKIDDHRFDQMSRVVKRFAAISETRHHLIHGEWWFDYLQDGLLKVRRVWKGEITYFDEPLTPGLLNELADELDAIAEELDDLEYAIGFSRRGED